MQNECKNSKSSEKFEVLYKNSLVSDKFKSELKENFEENRVSEVVNALVGKLKLNETTVGHFITADLSLADVNAMIDSDKVSEAVTVIEKLKEASISSIAEDVAVAMPKIVLIAGPSSSGKTTFCKKMVYSLQQQGLKPEMLSLDDYYQTLDKTPLDENGEYDFESLYALDLQLLQQHLQELVDGKDVVLPRYNFAEAKREWQPQPMKMTAESILLIEGIHGLNPELTGKIDPRLIYRIYISGSAPKKGKNGGVFLSTDNRLIRRLVRDAKYRGTSAQDTLSRWPSVRRGEQRWIVPYQKYANANINTSFPYELGLLRHEAMPLLDKVPKGIPEYYEAQRLLKMLEEVHPMDVSMVPKYSILREFLGDSGYEY